VMPPTTDPDSTIAIVGSSSSGKTCYLAALIRQIERRLSRPDACGMCWSAEDDATRNYLRAQEKVIFKQGQPPEATQKDAELISLRLTIRFPIRRAWTRWKTWRESATVSM